MRHAYATGEDEWLRVELRCGANSSTLSVSGFLSGTSIAALETQIDQLGSTACEEVVLDLRQLRDLDQRGALALFGLYQYVKGRGGRMRIVGARPNVAAALLRLVLRKGERVFDAVDGATVPSSIGVHL